MGNLSSHGHVEAPTGRCYRITARLRDVLLGGIALALLAPVLAVWDVLPDPRRGGASKQTRRSRRFAMASHRRKLKTVVSELRRVVAGELSLVGPASSPQAEAGRARPTGFVTPGLTGVQRISPDRTKSPSRRPEYDAFYIANRSFLFDLWLLWRTALLLIARRQTPIGLAIRLWERERSWRRLVPQRARALPPPRKRGPVWFVWGVGASTMALLLLPGAGSALSARTDLLLARQAMMQAREAAASLDIDQTKALLAEASESLRLAEGKLSGPATVPVRLIPGLRNNLIVPTRIVEAGQQLVSAGGRGMEVIHALTGDDASAQDLIVDGAINLDPLQKLQEPVRQIESSVQRARDLVADAPSSFLLPAVASARAEASHLLAQVVDQAERASSAVTLIPSIFGADGLRTFVLGAENIAELRGRGGFLGSFGLLSAGRGQVSLGEFQATARLPRLPLNPAQMRAPAEYERQYLNLGGLSAWANLVMSPDFPTGARVLMQALADHAGIQADGIIAVDPVALSYLLEVTGPVRDPSLPEPIDHANVVDWTLNRAYLLFPDESGERREQLSTIADLVWEKLLSTEGIDMQRVAAALSKAAAERHLVAYSTRPDEQALIEQLGISGKLTEADGDYLLLLGQNFGENKLDFYLARDIDYRASIHEDRSLTADVTVRIDNQAPADGPVVTYGGDILDLQDEPEGTARTLFSLFVPAGAEQIELARDGNPATDFEISNEMDKRRISTLVEVGPGKAQTLAFSYRVPEAVQDQEYELVVQKQSTVRPDHLSVQIRLPENLEAARVKGFAAGTGLAWEGELTRDMRFWAQLDSSLGDRIVSWLSCMLRRPVAGAAGG